MLSSSQEYSERSRVQRISRGVSIAQKVQRSSAGCCIAQTVQHSLRGCIIAQEESTKISRGQCSSSGYEVALVVRQARALSLDNPLVL